MFKPWSVYIGLRYTRAKRRNHFISFISLISMLGIALGVTALITVLSVMNGFEKELRKRMLDMAPHLELMASAGSMTEWEALAHQIKQTYPQRIRGIAPYVQGQAMIINRHAVYGTLLQGVLPEAEPEVSLVQEKLEDSVTLDDLYPGSFNIFIGKELQTALGVSVGDKVTLVVPQTSVTPVGILPRMKRMTVAGIFSVGMHEVDNGLVLMHIGDAAKLLRLPQEHVHGLNIKLHDMFDAYALGHDLSATLGPDYYNYPWTYRHANFFRAVKMEKVVMALILTLIVAVAAFNIVSTLVMVVTDKQADIAILRTLGATPGGIMRVFIIQGCIIGLFGTLLGAAGGISLALNVETIVPAIEKFFNTQFLDSSVYYISELPSDMRWPQVFVITSGSFVITLLATVYPAWQAARTQPAEALRYE